MQPGSEVAETDIDLDTGEIRDKPVEPEPKQGERIERLSSGAADRGIPSVAQGNSKMNWKGMLFFVPLIAIGLFWVLKGDEPQTVEATTEDHGAPAGFNSQFRKKSEDIMAEWRANNPVGPPVLPEPNKNKDTNDQQPKTAKHNPKQQEQGKTPSSTPQTTASQPSLPKGMPSREMLYAMASQPMGSNSGGQTGGNTSGRPGVNPYASMGNGNIEEALMGALTPKEPDRRDGNLQFRDREANKGVEKVQATQLTDMEYMVLQGTFVHVTLDTAIDSTLPGEVRGTVAKDVYGVSGSRVLIPRGSTLFGTHNSDVRRGQGRVFVVWTRLITPQGYDIPIGSSGGDNLGRAGFSGVVDHHFWERFGNATLLSLLGATLSNAGVDSDDQPNSANTYREALSMSFQSSSTRALEDNIDIPDTIYKDQGEPVIVFVNRDLDFSSVLKR